MKNESKSDKENQTKQRNNKNNKQQQQQNWSSYTCDEEKVLDVMCSLRPLEWWKIIIE